jgi:hypothetical protein
MIGSMHRGIKMENHRHTARIELKLRKHMLRGVFSIPECSVQIKMFKGLSCQKENNPVKISNSNTIPNQHIQTIN